MWPGPFGATMRGELDFEAALRERVGLLAGLDARILQEIYDERVTLMPGAATLVATMQANGATCALVSGGFSFYTERIAARLAFDTQQANTLDIVDGKIAGTVAEPILGREAKRAALQRLAAEHVLLCDEQTTSSAAIDRQNRARILANMMPKRHHNLITRRA